jgi:mycothiol synthase
MKNSLPKGYFSRPARKDDVEAAVEMFNIDAKHLVGVEKFALNEVANEWSTPGFNQETDARIVISPKGQVVGYCDVWDMKPHVSIDCWGRVHPAHTNLGIGSHLLEWAQGRAEQAIPKAPPEARVIMKCAAININQAAEELFQGADMERVRYFFRMVIDLDDHPPEPQWPNGIELRPIVLGKDEWPMTVAVVEAFKDHWGHVERPIEEEYERWMHHIKNNEDFDPELYFLAWDGDEIAGAVLCWPKSHEDEKMGWVDVLGVRQPWRKRGLGLALLNHSFGVFHQRGKLRVGLGVDAENLTGALRLYERAGMHADPNRTFVVYEQELRPGVDLRTVQVDQAEA